MNSRLEKIIPLVEKYHLENLTPLFISYHYDIEIVGDQKFREFQKPSKKAKHTVIISNHIAQSDLAVILALERKIFHKGIFRKEKPGITAVVASQWHLAHDPDYQKFFELLKKGYGINVLPVIQKYMADEPEEYGFTKEDIFASNRKLFHDLQELQDSGKPITLIIFPEGHRSDNALTMMPVQKIGDGFFKLGRRLSRTGRVRFITAGLEYPQPHDQGINLTLFRRTPVRACLAQAEVIENERDNRLSARHVITKLVKALPENQRPSDWREAILEENGFINTE